MKSLVVHENLFGYSLCGWVVLCGIDVTEKCRNKQTSVFSTHSMDPLESDLKNLWQLECLRINAEKNISELNKKILKKFKNNLHFLKHQYETKLLWKDDKGNLGNNYKNARNSFIYINRKVKINYYRKIKTLLKNALIKG